jgi:hypothetical protein
MIVNLKTYLIQSQKIIIEEDPSHRQIVKIKKVQADYQSVDASGD